MSPESKGKEMGKFLVSLDDSAVFSLFCTKVYGRDLTQMNRMDEPQFDRLLVQLRLTENDHVLDLGCGLGKITENISDITQSNITGVDFATDAIIRAQNRTKRKINRLNFTEADINDLSFPLESFSCVIAIDSLYGDFIDDLHTVFCKLVKFLKPDGQMGIFHTEYSLERDDLHPQMTAVALALKNQGLKFKTWDYTENELLLLEKKISVAKELEPKFKSNQYNLYERIIKHSEKLLLRIIKGESRRYFYHIKLH
ncbi:MAG: class I SAM-dependent methyltransferase [Candidatus Heimdallarchaeota archaeon]|nr:MAG: class I SAM-dependent methyltransferase [Candidatus Heimdallarchaeota archaeon]